MDAFLERLCSVFNFFEAVLASSWRTKSAVTSAVREPVQEVLQVGVHHGFVLEPTARAPYRSYVPTGAGMFSGYRGDRVSLIESEMGLPVWSLDQSA
jgi:hypothetical protein